MSYEDRYFYAGPRMVSLDGASWWAEGSPMGAFIDCWSWLDWVMRGCPPPLVCTKVDRERGSITYESAWMSAKDFK